jgi:hypothetical protein
MIGLLWQLDTEEKASTSNAKLGLGQSVSVIGEREPE